MYGVRPAKSEVRGMKITRLAKDGESGDHGCPAVYVADDDPAVMVVQGKFLDDDTTANLLDPAADETAVRIPAETMVRAVQAYLAAHGQ
jgi:hypothetical protein